MNEFSKKICEQPVAGWMVVVRPLSGKSLDQICHPYLCWNMHIGNIDQPPCQLSWGRQVLHQRWILGNVHYGNHYQMQIRLATLAARGDISRSPKHGHGYQWPHKRTCVYPKKFLKIWATIFKVRGKKLKLNSSTTNSNTQIFLILTNFNWTQWGEFLIQDRRVFLPIILKQKGVIHEPFLECQ